MRFIVKQDERGWHVYDTHAELVIGSTYGTEQAAQEAAATDERDHGWDDLEYELYREEMDLVQYDQWQMAESKMWDG